MRRVVVTGMGLVTPLGSGVKPTWERLIAGESGIRGVQSFDVSDLPAKVAAQVPRGETASGMFNADEFVPPKDQRKMDDFIIFAMGAASQAVEDSGWKPTDDYGRERTGVMIGSGIGGLQTIAETAITLKEKGPRRVSPFFIPSSLINLASGHVSIKYGFKGPNHSAVTACSTGAHAIGDATRLIQLDDADVMVAGGAEAAICRLGIAGFAAARALSTAFNDDPPKASRPWDKDRDGFVMGEGSGIVVLEEYEHAKKRGAKIYAEVIGYGMSGDAHHITSPAEDGNGAFRSMQMALKRAKLNRERYRLHQRARHLDAGRRRDRAGCRQAAVRRGRLQAVDVVDQIGDRASAGCRGQRRGDLLHPRHARQRGAADAQPRQSVRGLRHRLGAAQGQGA